MNEALHKEMDAGVDIAMTGHNHASNLNGEGSINYNGKSWFLFDDKTVNGDEAHKEMPQFYVFEMKGDKRCLQIRIKVILHLEKYRPC